MRKIYLICLILLGIAILGGCGGKPTVKNSTLVEEVKEYKGYFVGEGISGSQGDENIKKRQAKTRALNDIAQTIQVTVKSLTEDYAGITSTNSAAGKANSDLQDADLSDTIRTVSNQVLSGATVKQYETRSDGTIKAIVLMPKEQLLDEMGKRIPDQILREATRVKLNHEDAKKRLDDAITKMKADSQQ